MSPSCQKIGLFCGVQRQNRSERLGEQDANTASNNDAEETEEDEHYNATAAAAAGGGNGGNQFSQETQDVFSDPEEDFRIEDSSDDDNI